MTQEFLELDVRPIFRGGGEPFQAIMAAVDSLKASEGLKLYAPFPPLPLFPVMVSQGFDHDVVELEGGDFEVRFTPKDADVHLSADAVSPELWPDPVVELELSDLSPPEPMVRVLSELERLKPGEVLFALLPQEPLFLFPQLTKRGHQWAGNSDESTSLFRILIRAGDQS